MTLSDWVAALDLRIKDASNTLFSVAEKEAHLGAAVSDYSRHRPRLFPAEITTVAGRQSYDLPADCLWVARAALPAPEGSLVEGPDTEAPCRGWLEDAGQLWLFPRPETGGLPVRLTCAGAWSPETVPAQDEEAVLLAAHARCCEVLASDSARAFVFWMGNEKFDKSEVSAHYRELARDLRAEFLRRVR